MYRWYYCIDDDDDISKIMILKHRWYCNNEDYESITSRGAGGGGGGGGGGGKRWIYIVVVMVTLNLYYHCHGNVEFILSLQPRGFDTC